MLWLICSLVCGLNVHSLVTFVCSYIYKQILTIVFVYTVPHIKLGGDMEFYDHHKNCFCTSGMDENLCFHFTSFVKQTERWTEIKTYYSNHMGENCHDYY